LHHHLYYVDRKGIKHTQQNSQAEHLKHPTLEEYWKELNGRDAQEGLQWPGRVEWILRIKQLKEDPVIKNLLSKR